MTIFKTMQGGRAGGKNYWKELQSRSAEARKNGEWITEFAREEILKDIGDKFAKSLDKNITGRQEYEKHFLGNFDLQIDPGHPDGDNTTLRVQTRFGFSNGYIGTEKIRYMHHKKKRINKKWSKNPDYYITRSVKKQHMPLVMTATA